MNTDTIANSNADDPTKALCSLSQNWWLFVLRGVLALILQPSRSGCHNRLCWP